MNRTLIRLLRLMAPFKGWMALAVLLGAATVGSSIGLMATAAFLISAAALHPSIADLGIAIVGVRFFGLARGVCRYLERSVSHSVTFRLLARLRVWFYEAVEPLAPARLMRYQSGDLLSCVVADIETLQDFYVRVIAPPAVAGVIALAMAGFMWRYDPSLALVLLGFLSLTGIGVPILVRRLSRPPGRELVAARAELHARVVDGIQGLADLVACGQERRTAATIEATAHVLASAQRRLVWINGLQTGVSTLLMNGGMWVVVVLAILLVSAGRLRGLSLAVLALATLACFEAVLPLPLAAHSLEGALAAGRRLFALADAGAVVRDPARPVEGPATYSLEAHDLWFAYAPGDPPALDGVSFSLPAGRRIAVVGPSGAGKSTLVNLLLRFWEYDRGVILLGGVDLRDYAQSDVRRLIGVISSQAFLFNATIRDNILLARPDADEAAVMRAAQQAQLHDFIQSLPQGYETRIGERGLNLSGGERQRLAIARALLRSAPILILDEPTANLDPLTERDVLQAISAAMPGRTTLLITHRLVGLEAMDEILVLEAGRIIERGTHLELIARAGLYQRLWLLQNRADVSEFVSMARQAL
ncbi:MAG: thiol reductant ABC exporter subunit CydC [Ardenticatenaceae bacterium]|nr:thiol reductant ABC exporter subunit CydC [Ardenticatenaceae bacterium]